MIAHIEKTLMDVTDMPKLEPPALINEVQNIIASKLLYIPEFPGAVIPRLMDEIRLVILNYTHRREVPAKAKYIWANMAVDLGKSEFYASRTNAAAGVGEGDVDLDGVTSIRMGDTSVTFGSNTATDSGASKAAHKPNLDAVILNYEQQLINLRKLPF